MADIFISYKSERRAAARHLAETLTRHGFSVWYDYALVKGRDFSRQIDSEIRTAKVLVVLWCARSVQSEWVHDCFHESYAGAPSDGSAVTLGRLQWPCRSRRFLGRLSEVPSLSAAVLEHHRRPELRPRLPCRQDAAVDCLNPHSNAHPATTRARPMPLMPNAASPEPVGRISAA